MLLWGLGTTLIVGGGTPDNGLADPADPIVFFLFRVGVQQIGNFRGGNLKGIPFAGFQIRRFDRRAQGQIDHPVGRRVLVGTIKEFAALEQKEAPTPVLSFGGMNYELFIVGIGSPIKVGKKERYE